MVDVQLPTTDGRHIVLPRTTQPDRDRQILPQRLKLTLPPQPPPRITARAAQSSRPSHPSVVPTFEPRFKGFQHLGPCQVAELVKLG